MPDALANYKPKSGLFLKFNEGDEIKLRVLTLDPVVRETTWEKPDGDVVVATKFSFVVYNWTHERAQILEVGPGLLNKFVNLHKDADLPALNKMDIKINATGEGLKRRYEVLPMPQARTVTQTIVYESSQIKLDEAITDNKGRLSEQEIDEEPVEQPDEVVIEDIDNVDVEKELTGYEKAKATADSLKEQTDTVKKVFPGAQEEAMPEDFLL